MSKQKHMPVMLHEVMQCLNIKEDGWYVDATFGRGGHTQAILQQLGPNGRLFAVDKDLEAVHYARAQFGHDKRFMVFHGCFSELPSLLGELSGKIDGILVDLGVSSPQLDNPNRGFSFQKEAALDMRMDQTKSTSAKEWIANASSQEIKKVLRQYGEECDAHRIAEKIIQRRAITPIETTTQLSNLIVETKKRHKRKTHPATLSFQAIRMHVNQEMQALQALLNDAPSLLSKQGVLAILSFHSLEDRMVKRNFRQLIADPFPKKMPILEKAIKKSYDWQLKRGKPSINECNVNPRARSAVLRAIRKGT